MGPDRRQAKREDQDGLRGPAKWVAYLEAVDQDAALGPADLLAERGDLDGLRAQVDAGDNAVGERLADLLDKRGRSNEAERLRRFGLNPDGSIACMKDVLSPVLKVRAAKGDTTFPRSPPVAELWSLGWN